MLQKNMFVTGTVIKSRLPKSLHLTSDKLMARLGRGSSVIFASTSLQIEPANECRRWSKKDSQHIVKKYNEYMGELT